MNNNAIQIFEVSPRDGLQNQQSPIATADKITLINLLSKCGFQKIEVASFVSPKWVPQMADGADVMAGIARTPNCLYTALTPNLRGAENAITARADEMAIFASASEGFSQKNINCSIDESIERFQPVMALARAHNIPVRGYLSCVTDCPYDGEIAGDAVAKTAEKLCALGIYELSLGDTIGKAVPERVAQMLDAVLGIAPASKLAGHFHDTSGRALENIGVSIEKGLRVFDASASGLGGCPYAPGAKGNVATESVVAYVEQLNYETGIDRQALEATIAFINTIKE